MYKWCHISGRGVLGNLPQIIFGLNGVKSCNFRQYRHGNGTFMKARDSMYEGKREPFELGSDSDFFFFFFFDIYTMYKNNLWPPLLPIKYPHKTPPLINLMGVRTPAPPPPPPLDPLMLVHKGQSSLLIHWDGVMVSSV